MCHGEVVGVEHLPPILFHAGEEVPPPPPAPGRLMDQERQLILHTLEQVGWNKYKAAQVLGIARSTLYGKMEKFGLEPPPAAPAHS